MDINIDQSALIKEQTNTNSQSSYCTHTVSVPKTINGTKNNTKELLQILVPNGYTSQFLCKSLQGHIFILNPDHTNINNNNTKLALKQVFKSYYLQNANKDENVKKEYYILNLFQNLDVTVKIIHEWYEDKDCYYYTTQFANYGDLLEFFNAIKLKIIHIKQKADYYYYQQKNIAKCSNYFQQFNILQNNILKIIPNIFNQLCKIVRCLHENNCAHLDLSCENIVVTNYDANNNNIEIKCIDFGVAQIFPSNKHEIFDKFVGKPLYMAPEVWQCYKENNKNNNNNNTYNPFKADIWSLGVILYLLYMDTFPFPIEHQRTNYNCYSFQNIFFCKFVPSNVIDLLLQIFVPQNKRLDIFQVLNHSYLTTQQKNIKK